MRAAYSPKKISTNKIPLNSVLNPDTSSLSPSTKSKGVRILSARQHNKKTSTVDIIHTTISLRDRVKVSKVMYRRKRNLNTISYDTVCATARRPPTTLYLQPLPHPAPNLPKTWALNRAKISTTRKQHLILLLFIGNNNHRKKGTARIDPADTQYR